jgi:hypothetical protein
MQGPKFKPQYYKKKFLNKIVFKNVIKFTIFTIFSMLFSYILIIVMVFYNHH